MKKILLVIWLLVLAEVVTFIIPPHFEQKADLSFEAWLVLGLMPGSFGLGLLFAWLPPREKKSGSGRVWSRPMR